MSSNKAKFSFAEALVSCIIMCAFGCFSIAVWKGDIGLGWKWALQGVIFFVVGLSLDHVLNPED